MSAHNTTLTVEDVVFDSCVSGESGGGLMSGTSNVTITRARCLDTISNVGA
jgi:hypothetical protein